MRDEDFEHLFTEHAEPLLGFLLYRVGDRPTAEDVLADTFERAYRARRRFDRRKASEKTWLYAIALNCLRDRGRRRDAEARALARASDSSSRGFDDDMGTREATLDLLEALGTLAEEERTAVALRYGADLPMSQIARTLDEPLTTVEGRVYRGLRKLRASL